MVLETTTYSAFRGYSWSSVPSGLSTQKLDQLYRMVSAARGDFPDPLSVETGLVSDGATAAAFTLQNVDHWDSERRASNYAAFALMPIEQAANVDFVDLLNNDFFWTPSRAPATTLDYRGKASTHVPPLALKQLMTTQRCLLQEPRAVGAILTACGRSSPRWVCLMRAENEMLIECDKWTWK